MERLAVLRASASYGGLPAGATFGELVWLRNEHIYRSLPPSSPQRSAMHLRWAAFIADIMATQLGVVPVTLPSSAKE